MTKIIRFTTAEWKARQRSRSTSRSYPIDARTSNIIIFPGVRVEYHDPSWEMDHSEDQIEKRVSRRLRFYPASGERQE